MINADTLVSGCSHSESSGFNQSNIDLLYVNILKKKTNWVIDNIAIGGMSNNEIFFRTLEYCATHRPKRCIVQWSSLHRLWLYERENNVDDFAIIMPRVTGFLSDKTAANQLEKIIVSQFCNDYVEVKHLLLKMIALQNFFKHNQIDYLFVNGFQNFITDIHNLSKIEITSLADIILPAEIKRMLNFDNNPDYYIINKLNILTDLYKQLDQSSCLDFGNFYFGSEALDLADDNKHWGKKCNQLWANRILKHFNV